MSYVLFDLSANRTSLPNYYQVIPMVAPVRNMAKGYSANRRKLLVAGVIFLIVRALDFTCPEDAISVASKQLKHNVSTSHPAITPMCFRIG